MSKHKDYRVTGWTPAGGYVTAVFACNSPRDAAIKFLRKFDPHKGLNTLKVQYGTKEETIQIHWSHPRV